ncbi:MAG TPA: hypothetical protein VL285_23935 [Bryobacteraceae bacterium]|nr:hypothetical protein [Bryobacteraceae bacterium]
MFYRTAGVMALYLIPGFAQQAGPPAHDHSKMAGQGAHSMPSMNHGSNTNEAGAYLMNMASGTSLNPESWPMPMLASRSGSWNFMFMGQAFLMDTQQSGARGGDKFFAPNWFMGSAERSLGRGSIMLQTMFSLDPATVTNRSYPLLFQTGETAFGKPLVDAQHPHDLFMNLGVHYARPLGKSSMLQLYYAPVGDPALGPVAFPHRASAAELPQASLGHHWQDSTHIAANVATVAIKHKWLRLEASGFHGTEPDENRWNIDWGAMNSYSGRVSVFPGKNWMGQFSMGKLIAPEPYEEGDVVRTTASLHYTRPAAKGNAWSTSLIWGRNRKTASGHGAAERHLNSYLLETLVPLSPKNFITGRAELVDKDELFDAERPFRIGAYTAGYTRDVAVSKYLVAGLGANVTTYALPEALKSSYGNHPWGVSVYARFRLKPEE